MSSTTNNFHLKIIEIFDKYLKQQGFPPLKQEIKNQPQTQEGIQYLENFDKNFLSSITQSSKEKIQSLSETILNNYNEYLKSKEESEQLQLNLDEQETELKSLQTEIQRNQNILNNLEQTIVTIESNINQIEYKLTNSYNK